MLAALVRRRRRRVSATRWRGGGRRVRRSVGAQLRDCSGANDLIGPPSALSICRTHTPPAIARVLCAAISATPDNTRPLPPPSHRCRSGARGRCREAESPATSASPRPVLLFSNGKFALIGRQVGRQVGEQLGFASNKLGTTASSNATRRRAESCVSRYFGGCRFGFVGRGADEHSQGEVGGADSRNGATRAAKPSDDVRSVRFRLGFCKYELACAGTCVLVRLRRGGAGAHVLCGPLWQCGSSRRLPLRFGSSTRRSGAGDAFRGFVGV